MRGWAESEEDLPADGEEVEDGFACGDLGDLTVLVLGWVEHDSVQDLLAPGDVLLTVDSVEELLKGFSLLFGLGIGDDLDKDTVLLRDFDNVWLGVENLYAEDLVSLVSILHVDILDDLNHDLLAGLLVLEDKLSFLMLVVDISEGATVFGHIVEFISLKLTRNSSIRSICPIHDNTAKFFSRHVFDVGSLLLECKEAWLIIIDDGDDSLGVLSIKVLFALWVEESELEVSVRLPLIIVVNFDLNCLVSVSGERNNSLHVVIVFSWLRTICDFDSFETNFTLHFLLVVDLDLKCATSLGD